jgi:hypothetical protein
MQIKQELTKCGSRTGNALFRIEFSEHLLKID